jgi:hypothetical protein
MASAIHHRIGRTLLPLLLAAVIGMPLGAAFISHGDPAAPVAGTACGGDPAPDPVRFRFWIGSFEFSLSIGGQTGFALAFEGLR